MTLILIDRRENENFGLQHLHKNLHRLNNFSSIILIDRLSIERFDIFKKIDKKRRYQFAQ